MSKAVIITLILFSAVTVSLTAQETDNFGFVNINLELFDAIIIGDYFDLGSGASTNFNAGDFLFHAGFMIHYIEALGFVGDASVGYVFHAVYDESAEYTQVFKVGEDAYYDYYQTIRGTCRAAWLHALEIGVRPYFIDGYEDYSGAKSVSSDIVFYAGYRLASFYAEIMPTQEVDLSIRGVLGLVNRSFLEDGSLVASDSGRVTWGFLAGLRYYIANFEIGMYDNQFYGSVGFRFAFNIM